MTFLAGSLETGNSIETLTDVRPAAYAEVIAEATEPVVMRGLVADWPVVKRAQESAEELDTYLRRLYQGATVGMFLGQPEIGGRFFYNEDMTGLNFERSREKFDAVLDKLKALRNNPAAPSIYVGATTIDNCLPGFRADNKLDFGDLNPLASIWIGNRTRIAAHFDLPDNVACVAAGHRRFTLFPPDQIDNLYVGPIDFTPAGQQISLVDFHNPDPERYPKFSQAMEHALHVDMAPGDALFLPSMWWHHVESLDDFNVLVNYWWRKSPGYMGPPIDVLHHALLALRDLPPEQKKAWQGIFNHYIFGENSSLEHIPVQSRGSLGQLDETMARKLRALLLNRINR